MLQLLLPVAGKTGSGIAGFLAAARDCEIAVADRDSANPDRLPPVAGIRTLHLDAGAALAPEAAVAGKFAVVDAATVKAVGDAPPPRLRAHGARTRNRRAMISQCGLAPEFAFIAACEPARKGSSDQVRASLRRMPAAVQERRRIREQDKTAFCLAAMNNSMDGIIQRIPASPASHGAPSG